MDGEIRVNLDQQDFSDLVDKHEVLKIAHGRDGSEVRIRIIFPDIPFSIMWSAISASRK